MPPAGADMDSGTAGGDAVVLADLFARHEAHVMRFARHLTRDPDQAEELYQETWLRLARRLRDRGPGGLPGEPRKWLFTVTANLFRDELRRRKVRRRSDGGSLDDEDRHLAPAAKAPASDERLAQRQGLERALAALSERQRTAFLLVHVEGFRLREAAEILDVAEGTVKSTLHRAAAILRERLAEFRK